MEQLERALTEAGGTTAPPASAGRLRRLLLEELDRGREELTRPRSGYAMPVAVAVASCADALVGVAPVSFGVRADPDAASEREWLVGAALAGALCEAASLRAPSAAGDLVMVFGELEGHLVLALPARDGDAELAAVAYEEATAAMDRLRTRALALPGHVLDGAYSALSPPVGVSQHPLRVAEAVARLGGRPADPASVEVHEEAVLAVIGGDEHGPSRPHEDPDPARRVARRLVARERTLDGDTARAQGGGECGAEPATADDGAVRGACGHCSVRSSSPGGCRSRSWWCWSSLLTVHPTLGDGRVMEFST
ncbi:MAG: hypothetical protein KY462_17030, partial [Actinobacteria bacterium]|nr:hypothetical protein [Actinomycetota bacterium]